MEDRLKYLAGSELGAGTFTADTLPEEKARELQAGRRAARLSPWRCRRAFADVFGEGGRSDRARPRQPARRAHRLQRRLRAADRDPAAATVELAASPRRSLPQCIRPLGLTGRPFAPRRAVPNDFASLRLRLRRGARAARHRRCRRSTMRIALRRCRSGSACRRSAALEVAVLRGCAPCSASRSTTWSSRCSRSGRDRVRRRACGIMDQMASSLVRHRRTCCSSTPAASNIACCRCRRHARCW
jgi:hypothetical protein